jgi:hypothetical protein
MYLLVTKWKIFAFYNISYLIRIAREDVDSSSLCDTCLMPYLMCDRGPVRHIFDIKGLLVLSPRLHGLIILFCLNTYKDRESPSYHIRSNYHRYETYHIRSTTLGHRYRVRFLVAGFILSF